MPRFTLDEVAVLAKANGMALEDDDLVEVTHRLNKVLSALNEVKAPIQDRLDPISFLVMEEQLHES